MSLKSKQKWMIGIAVLMIIAVIGVYGSGFATVGEDDIVWIPQYASFWCGDCDIGTKAVSGTPTELRPGFFGEEFKIYECAEGDYAPNGCDFKIQKIGGTGETGVYVCDEDVNVATIEKELSDEITPARNGEAIEGCERYGDNSFSSLVKSINVKRDRILYLMTEEKVNVNANYFPFCLWMLERGKMTKDNTCNNNILLAKAKALPEGENIPQIIIAGQQNPIENVIIGYSGFIDNINVVTHPSTGQSVFLTKQLNELVSCPIRTDENGRLFVDEGQGLCKKDSSFKCLPSQPPQGFMCIGGTELVKVEEGATCKSGGERVVGDKKCVVSCVDGKQSFDECEKIEGIIDGGELKPKSVTLDLLPLYIILGIGLLAIILAIVLTRKKKK